jgi:formylglycine-generating enzyme required for sulfatase activity
VTRTRSTAARALRQGAPTLGVCLASACSGPAFELSLPDVDRVGVGGGARDGGLPPLSTHGGELDAGVTVAPPPDARGSADPEPPPGPCGAAREANEDLKSSETCIPAGSFEMGSSASALGAGYVTHGPVHPVTLSAFFIDTHEVTVARYRACVDAGSCLPPEGVVSQACTYSASPGARELHPVTCVTWAQAQGFCSWDGGRSLPSEARWERAARGSDGSTYPWGEGFECSQAILAGASQCREHGGVAPHPVGSAPAGASPEGVLDLVGNASEWVSDWFASYPADGGTDPVGPSSGSARVLRGGGWLTPGPDAVAYARRAESPQATGSFSFRCARSAAP